jgi:hypothetical protein
MNLSPVSHHRFWKEAHLVQHMSRLADWQELVAIASISRDLRDSAQREATLRSHLVVAPILESFNLSPSVFFDILDNCDSAMVGTHSARIIALKATNIKDLNSLKRITVVSPAEKARGLIAQLRRKGLVDWRAVLVEETPGSRKSVAWVSECTVGSGSQVCPLNAPSSNTPESVVRNAIFVLLLRGVQSCRFYAPARQQPT